MGKKFLHGTMAAAVPLDIVRDTPAAPVGMIDASTSLDRCGKSEPIIL